jgi:hypothetical protein
MDRRTAAFFAASALVVSGVGSVSAAGPTGIAAGAFTYHPFGGRPFDPHRSRRSRHRPPAGSGPGRTGAGRSPAS